MIRNRHLGPSRILLLSFAGLILLGAFLLMLPISSRTNTWTPFLDALFTSTSATCVTGLIIYDTYSHWSFFGQFIIICLIQIGGLGVAQGANIALDCAVFEPVHGSAPDIKGQNKANPTALLLSAIEMLKYISEFEAAEKIEKALFKTLESGECTADLGGKLGTKEFADAIIKNLD